MKQLRKILVLFLAVIVLLGGCMWQPGIVKFEDMEYYRPDIADCRMLLEECTALAEAGEDFREFEDSLWEYLAWYNGYYTNYCLADIRYCADLTDIYWTEEYNYYMETMAEVDAGMDRLHYVMAASDFREELEGEEYFGEDYFAEYDGESLWDAEFTVLMEEEAALISRYYDLSTQLLDAPLVGEEHEAVVEQMCRLYVELIAKRQEIAAEAGYEDYPHFAYDFYYARDYTPEQEVAYIEQIRQELVPLYRYLCTYGLSGAELEVSTESQTLAYVRGCAREMGGTVWEAYQLMEEAGLYDISPGENKYDASFEVYLYDYYEPFVFLNPEGSSYDKLTLAHEFGHFCNDYASWGSAAGIDVAEIFSQGMTYLSTCYGENAQELEKLCMLDSLCIYVEQAAYASFEGQAYQLDGEDLTVENLCALYAQVAADFGFDIWGADSLDFTGVTHFYTNPMYVFSYVVSNDAAMQLYQLERETAGAGLSKYQENLNTTEAYFLAFLESTGLESPFDEGRIREVRQTLEEILDVTQTAA